MTILLSMVVIIGSFFFPLVDSEGKENFLATTSSYQTFNGKNFNNLPKNKRIPVSFKKKIDGDTFRVLLNNKEIKVKLLLIFTPESVKQGIARVAHIYSPSTS